MVKDREFKFSTDRGIPHKKRKSNGVVNVLAFWDVP